MLARLTKHSRSCGERPMPATASSALGTIRSRFTLDQLLPGAARGRRQAIPLRSNPHAPGRIGLRVALRSHRSSDKRDSVVTDCVGNHLGGCTYHNPLIRSVRCHRGVERGRKSHAASDRQPPFRGLVPACRAQEVTMQSRSQSAIRFCRTAPRRVSESVEMVGGLLMLLTALFFAWVA